MSYVPDQGDIITLSFDPGAGHEIMKRRPAIVISKKIFNQHTGLAVVAPITSTIRNIRLEVVLPKQCSIQGAILVHQLKSFDFEARDAELVEKSPASVIRRVIEIARVIVS